MGMSAGVLPPNMHLIVFGIPGGGGGLLVSINANGPICDATLSLVNLNSTNNNAVSRECSLRFCCILLHCGVPVGSPSGL